MGGVGVSMEADKETGRDSEVLVFPLSFVLNGLGYNQLCSMCHQGIWDAGLASLGAEL